MNDPQLEFTVRHWILRLLASPRSEKLFFKEHEYGDNDVARSLNLPDPYHPYNRTKARNALRKPIRQAGDLHEDCLPPDRVRLSPIPSPYLLLRLRLIDTKHKTTDFLASPRQFSTQHLAFSAPLLLSAKAV